jgi:hypothetical protein
MEMWFTLTKQRLVLIYRYTYQQLQKYSPYLYLKVTHREKTKHMRNEPMTHKYR